MMRRSYGFTLVEVVVALALASVVAFLAQRLYGGLLDAAATAERGRLQLDRWANSSRILAGLVGSLEISNEPKAIFGGEPQRVSFSTWVVDAHGWPEQRRVTLSLRDGALVADGLDGGTLTLRASITSLDLDYLLTPGADAPWIRAWSSEVSAPIAIRVRLTALSLVDTLLLVVGPRG